MIVTVAEIKNRLGIEEDDHDDDARIEGLILAATAHVHRLTLNYFDVPVARKEEHDGTGERRMYLDGHVDESDPPEEWTGDVPRDSVRVFSRGIFTADDLAELEDADWRRSKDILISLGSFGVWSRQEEFQITYLDGYFTPPDDIKQLIIEMTISGYNAEVNAATSVAGLTGEKIGDYSYTVDPSAAQAAATIGGLGLTEFGQGVIDNWRRKLA